MDSRDKLDSYVCNEPLPGLSESELEAMFDDHVDDIPDIGLTDGNPMFDWNALPDFYYCSPGISDDDLHHQQNNEAFETLGAFPLDTEQEREVAQPADILSDPAIDLSLQDPDLHLIQRGFRSVPQWLDGFYRPPVPCSYCRRHRLQCLTIRTTSANPNPITSCSSCVALFRECSLAHGEKRQPSGFETLSPVMGHLHGVTEQPEDGDDYRQGSLLNASENNEDRKESKQFVRKGARFLREWFEQNQEYPYPSEDQKSQLSRETGFSKKRISTWFANARRRQKQKIESSMLPHITRAASPAPRKLASMTPMERWQASPPEDEPVPEAAIQDAISSIPVGSGVSDQSRIDGSTVDSVWNPEETSSHLTPSVSSFGSLSETSSGSALSAWSYHSSGEALPFPLLPRRSSSTRGRRRSRRGGDGGNQYQCTFCLQSFKRKHDWYRHEKSVHLPLESWICTPDLTMLQQTETLPSECRFCETTPETPSHREEHEFHICAEKPVAERSFSRKDHLWQHLRKFHGCTKMPDIENWRGTGANVRSVCGFCGASLSSWKERADHITDHFKKGSRMDHWVGDWGLDSSVMGILRSAVLPSERSSLLP